jgi:HEAT repeat protein
MTDPIALADVVPPDHAEGMSLLIEMSQDEDSEIRDWATAGLAGLEADTPQIREALAARLTDEDLRTVAEAARGLAIRGDERADQGVRRVLDESDDEYARDLVTQTGEE